MFGFPRRFINAVLQTAGNAFVLDHGHFNLYFTGPLLRGTFLLPVSASVSNVCFKMRIVRTTNRETAVHWQLSSRGCLCILIIPMTRVQLKRTPFSYLFSSERTQREGEKKFSNCLINYSPHEIMTKPRYPRLLCN